MTGFIEKRKNVISVRLNNKEKKDFDGLKNSLGAKTNAEAMRNSLRIVINRFNGLDLSKYDEKTVNKINNLLMKADNSLKNMEKNECRGFIPKS